MRPHTLLALAALLLLAGCRRDSKSSGGDPDAGMAAAATVTSAAVPSASAASSASVYANAADVKRYENEEAMTTVKASLTHDAMRVRADVPNGAVVATLKKGQEVSEISSHAGFVLIAFPDPKDPSKQLIGWIAKGAFSAVATGDATDHVSSCPAKAAEWIGPPVSQCAQSCAFEKDCSKPCLGDYIITSCSECGAGEKCLAVQHNMEDGVGWSKACIGRGKGCPAAAASAASPGKGCPPGFVKGTGEGAMPNLDVPGCFRVCTKTADCSKDMDMERVCKGGRCVAAP